MSRPNLVRDVTGFDFDAWRAENARASAILRAALADHIAAGGTVEETAPGFVAVWSLTRHPFVKDGRITADYLAEHLVSRHDGWGFKLRMVPA